MKGPPIQWSAGGKIASLDNSNADHSKKIHQPWQNVLKEQSAQ